MKNLIYMIKQLTKKKNDFDELTDKINKITPNQSQKIEELQEKIDKNKQEVNKTSKKKKSSTDSDEQEEEIVKEKNSDYVKTPNCLIKKK